MTGVCFCLRHGSWGFSPNKAKPIAWTCSQAHASIAAKNYGKENAMTEAETKARATAVEMVGEYLKYLGKTDLATFDNAECDMLVLTIIETYRDEMTKACEPF